MTENELHHSDAAPAKLPRDLKSDPLWRAADLGHPIPDSPHAASVALPLWEHVIGYEEGDEAVCSRMHCGYPRFVQHPLVRELFSRAESRLGNEGERAIVFPDEASATRAFNYVRRHHATSSVRLAEFQSGASAVALLAGEEQALSVARQYWRYSGEVVSSRMAQALLDTSTASQPSSSSGPVTKLKESLAERSGQAARDVFLYATGMAAWSALLRALQNLYPGRPTAQIEFPYVDVLRIQEDFGSGYRFFLKTDDDLAYEQLAMSCEKKEICGVFAEIPSNPMLRMFDLPRVSEICRENNIPLIVDDTIASVCNVDSYEWADVVTTSLTKFTSGVGDVMGGANTVSAHSPLSLKMLEVLREAGEFIWPEDAAVILDNSREFSQRMDEINANARALVDWLRKQPAVSRILYPGDENEKQAAFWQRIQRRGGGQSGLFSLVLKGGEEAAAAFYNALGVNKGPSLGTDFTLACPYVLLAHYQELDWVEREHNIPRHLIRVSVGRENIDDLIARFAEALSAI